MRLPPSLLYLPLPLMLLLLPGDAVAFAGVVDLAFPDEARECRMNDLRMRKGERGENTELDGDLEG